MKESKKKVAAVSMDDIEKIVLEKAQSMGNVLTQDDVDTFMSTYDLSDEAMEDLLQFINDSSILIEDGLDALEIDDDILAQSGDDLGDLGDLEDFESLDDDLGEDGPDLDFVGDFDMATSDTMSMYSDSENDDDDANQLGSNVKINDPVKMYLKEIGRVELLTHEEEITLAKLILQGDEEAKKRLAAANLRLVVSIAK